jgi:pimeloyl-ACP methyl ester carboxylesterase
MAELAEPAPATVATASRRQMVLVHGAWQGSWAWQAWQPELQRLGWHASAVDLPGNGVDPADRTLPADVSPALYTAHVIATLQRLGGPVVLVSHSGGGVVASMVAEAMPEAVACLVYVAGMMLPDGLSFRELVQQEQAAQPRLDLGGIVPHLQWSADGLSSSVPADAARAIFLHDCDAAAAAAAAARLTPQPERGRAIAPSLSAARYGRVPRVYVEALADRSLHLPLQRRMQALSPGALRLAIDCGHVPQLARPRQLAELLCRELDRLAVPTH